VPELLDDARLAFIGTVLAEPAPAAVDHERGLGVYLPGLRIDGQGDKHDLFALITADSPGPA
jgi:hypothetical protein